MKPDGVIWSEPIDWVKGLLSDEGHGPELRLVVKARASGPRSLKSRRLPEPLQPIADRIGRVTWPSFPAGRIRET